MKKSFIIYHSYSEAFDTLTDAELGELFRAMMQYSRTGTAPDLPGMLKFAFAFIKTQMDADNDKYEQTISGRKTAAGKRWENAKNANADFALQKMQNDANDADEVDVDVDVVPNGTDTDAPARENAISAIEEWNATCDDLPKVQMITDQRRARMKKTIEDLKKRGITWTEYLRKVTASDFLCGRSGDWRADFDFCTRPAIVAKVIEGNYDNRGRGAPKPFGGRGDRYADDLYAELEEGATS